MCRNASNRRPPSFEVPTAAQAAARDEARRLAAIDNERHSKKLKLSPRIDETIDIGGIVYHFAGAAFHSGENTNAGVVRRFGNDNAVVRSTQVTGLR
jgi:hypothetical protein